MDRTNPLDVLTRIERGRPISIVDRIEFGDCWLWTGGNKDGYGKIRQDGVLYEAHRFMWELLVGPIPDGLQIDHLCQVPACLNPDHLEPVTPTENLRRGHVGQHDRGTTCKHGHSLQGENLYITPDNRRQCKACNRIRTKKYYDNRRGR